MLSRGLFTVSFFALANFLQAAGLGDPGRLESLSIETGRSHDDTFSIAGRNAGQQLLVTGHYTSEQVRDLTRQVTFTATPKGIVNVSPTGWVTSVAEGEATIHVTVGRALLPVSSNATGKSARTTPDATTRVVVTDIVHDLPVNFPNEVVPIYPKRLNAEVLLDAIDQLTMSPTRFQGMPNGTRAVELPDNAFDSYFLTVFGRPNSSSACECERSSDASLAQLLHLINSSEILSKAGGTRAANLAKDKRPREERIRDLYLVALAREPSPEELVLLTTYIEGRGSDAKAAYEDIIWTLINAEEFLFNH